MPRIPFLDSPNITAQLRETGAKRSLFGTEKALVVRCVEQKLDVFVVWGVFGALGFSLSSAPPLDVIWRFDSTSPANAGMVSFDEPKTPPFRPSPGGSSG